MSDQIIRDTFEAGVKLPPIDYAKASESTLGWRASAGDAMATAELKGRGLIASVFHLPGKHNQKTHGRGGGTSAPLPELDVGFLGRHTIVPQIPSRTSDQAMKEANPNYSDEPIHDPLKLLGSYQINCTHAVAAYELRRRGYDVEARPGLGSENVYFKLDYSNERRVHTNETPPRNTEGRVTSVMVDAYPVGSRGSAQVNWTIEGSPERAPSGLSHIFTWERDEKGVQFIDPQRGKLFPKEAWDRTVGTVILERLDNAPFNTGIKEAVKVTP